MRIKEIRQARNLQQKVLANELGIKQNTLSQYENGVREPDLEMLRKIANKLEVSIDYLLGNNDQLEEPTAKDDGLSEDQKYLIAAVRAMSADSVRKLRIIVEEVISPQGQ